MVTLFPSSHMSLLLFSFINLWLIILVSSALFPRHTFLHISFSPAIYSRHYRTVFFTPTIIEASISARCSNNSLAFLITSCTFSSVSFRTLCSHQVFSFSIHSIFSVFQHWLIISVSL